MNDFTKEELEDLHVIVAVWYAKNIDDKQTGKLRDKIKSMIENYCEHEIKAKAHEWSVKYTCMKCGELIENDNQ